MTEREMIIAMIVKGYGVAWGAPDGWVHLLVVKRDGGYQVLNAVTADMAEYADPGTAADNFLAMIHALKQQVQ